MSATTVRPTVITVPASSRCATRRAAHNPHAPIYAYVVRDKAARSAHISVSLKRSGRVLGLSLRGHAADIVDLEFLATTADDAVHVLASCDTDGVVFLWFVYVATDALSIDVALRLLKKYSFYSLRKSTAAYYSRVRLTGSVKNGTMILVPNDGSSCRVVTFNCHTANPSATEQVPAIEAAAAPAQLMPPPQTLTSNVEAHSQPPTDDNQLLVGSTSASPSNLGSDLQHVLAEGKRATEALVDQPIPYSSSQSQSQPQSQSQSKQQSVPQSPPQQAEDESSTTDHFVDALSKMSDLPPATASATVKPFTEKVQVGEDKTKNMPQAPDISMDYADLREIDEEEVGREDFVDPEVEFIDVHNEVQPGSAAGREFEGDPRMNPSYEQEGEYEAQEYGATEDDIFVAAEGFDNDPDSEHRPALRQ